ncbi:uncharacterized protein LOC132200172 [Neocloeon triangulifer]|uniref:uncharacterized protein LOC132200172 n=1 Tax=Neocloeon triangulifer TaxID=2078957 RepID=UPI00286EDBAD|nr:uncharacterized protein LOC132200172 [Neocloeon triangulifer]
MKPLLLAVVALLTLSALLEAAPQGENDVSPVEPAFTLPVQLVGFPVIIMAVKFANFLKKLTYSLNPKTYVGRVRRGTLDGSLLREHLRNSKYQSDDLDLANIEHQLVSEMGPDVCLFEEICNKYSKHSKALDWEDVVKEYEHYAGSRKKFFLLSVFLGEIVSSPKLCHQIASRPGRSCQF